jgi:hypothetical protein
MQRSNDDFCTTAIVEGTITTPIPVARYGDPGGTQPEVVGRSVWSWQ